MMWLALIAFVTLGWPLLFVLGKAMLYATDDIEIAPIREFLALMVIAAFISMMVGGATLLAITASAQSF